MPLTRRTLLQTSAAAVAVAHLPAAQAQAEEGVFRFTVGGDRGLKGVMIHDGVLPRPLTEGFVRNASLAEVQAALAAAGLPTDTIEITFTQTLIDTGSEVVLIDTGTGGKLGDGAGRMLANMAKAGYAPEKVTKVVISHFHPDHFQGLTTGDGKDVFPNAELSVPVAEWLFWMDEGEMSRAPEALKGLFQTIRGVFEPKAREIRLIEAGREVAPGIRMEAAPGHTPGHSVFRVSSGSDQLLILSDTTNRPELFVRNPEWQVMFDMNPVQAVTTRKRLFDEVATDRIRIASYHYPFPAHGVLERDGAGYRFVPATA